MNLNYISYLNAIISQPRRAAFLYEQLSGLVVSSSIIIKYKYLAVDFRSIDGFGFIVHLGRLSIKMLSFRSDHWLI